MRYRTIENKMRKDDSMKKTVRILTCLVALLFISSMVAFCPSELFAAKPAKTEKAAKADKAVKGSMADKFPKPLAAYDVNKMGDMSDFDPALWVPPTGDTIKIAYVNAFSGPGAINGQIHLASIIFAAHDINKRGGILVDGKRKMIEVIAADTMSKPDQTKKICE